MKKGYSSNCVVSKVTSRKMKTHGFDYHIGYYYTTPKDKFRKYHFEFYVSSFSRTDDMISFDIVSYKDNIVIPQKHIEFTHFTDRTDIQIMRYLIKEFLYIKFGCTSE